MDYYKYHALGNDYILIDPQKTYIKLNQDNIRLICHRNYGIGADGILYGPHFEDDKISVAIYNSDGSEAEKSGNGIRIFSRYLSDENYIVDQEFQIFTKSGAVQVTILDKEKSLIKVAMGSYTFKSGAIPVAGSDREVIDEKIKVGNRIFHATCVSVGNPHCVIHTDTTSMDLAVKYGPLLETDPLFPNRINVQFVQILDRNNIKIEIWERGSGYTLSSGSSSCAAACASYRKGLVDSKVTVHMPGGSFIVEIDNGNVYLTGPVMSISEGIFTYEMWGRITTKI